MNSPRHTDDTPDLRELLVPYVLGELGDAERATLEQQLAADAGLRAELQELERTNFDLAAAVPLYAPPPALKSRVLDAIDAASSHEQRAASPAQAAPATEAAGASSPGANVAGAAGTPPAASPTSVGGSAGAGSTASQRESWLSRVRERFTFAPALAGALAVGCALLLTLLIDARGELNESRDQLAVAQRSLQEAERQPDVTRVVDTNRQFAGSTGRLMRDGDEWMLVFDGVPNPGKNASWQVWTADKAGNIRNIAQWTGNDPTHVLKLGSVDEIGEVMISHEHDTAPADEPSGEPFASATT